MISVASYRPASEFSLLITGVPKSGKTTLMLSFPDIGVIDCDMNMTYALRRALHFNPNANIKIATVDVDDNGKEVPRPERWTRLVEQTALMVADPTLRYIGIDPIGKVSTYLCDHIINEGGGSQKATVIGGEKVMNQQYWYPYAVLLERLVVKVRSSGKKLIVCSHLVTDKDEITGKISYRPTVSGQLRDRFGGFFTDVWTTEIRPRSGSTDDEVIVRTRKTPNLVDNGTPLDLPAEWVFNYKELISKLSPKPIAPVKP